MKARLVMVDTNFSVARDPKALLRVRIDCIPEEGELGYEEQLVNVPIRPLTSEELADPQKATLVPTVQQVNPIICIFDNVPPDVTHEQIQELMLKHIKAIKDRLARIEATKEVLEPAIERVQDWVGLEVIE